MKNWLKSKTIWLAILQATAGALTAVTTESPELTAVGWLAISKSVVDVVLRFLTKESVS